MFNRDNVRREEYGQKETGKFNFYDLVTERKLSRALRNTAVVRFEKMIEEELIPASITDTIIKDSLNMEYETRYSPDVYAFFLKMIFNMQHDPSVVHDIVRTTLPIIKRAVKYQFMYMHSQNHRAARKDILTGFNEWIKTIKAPDELLTVLAAGSAMNKVLPRMAKIRDIDRREKSFDTLIADVEKINKHSIPEYNMQIIWGYDLVLIVFDDECVQYVCPSDIILQFTNKLHDLSSILLLTQFSKSVCLPSNALTLLKSFLNEMIDLCLEYKVHFFTIAKSLEGIVNAEILRDVEDWDNSEFLISINEELKSSIRFNYLSSRLRKIIVKAPTNYKYELGCLSKILGHPYVDMESGVKKMFKKAQKYYHIDYTLVERSISHIKQNFVKNYYARNSKWPPHQLNYGCSKMLEYASLMNLSPHSPKIPREYHASHTIEHWHFVDLLPCEDFCNLEQALPYLKDRTITLMRQQVEENFINEEENKEWVDWRMTRLLLAFLISPEVTLNHTRYIKDYAKSVTLDDLIDYLVIRVVPKEKELKVDFRGFGCKTYEDRMRCLAQEKTVVQYLEKYSEDQAMAIDEIALQKKLRSFRNMFLAYEPYHLLYVNIDASSWCSHMREETIDFAMKKTLDKIYNNKTFGKTQLAYQKTLIYVPDGDKVHYWDGQLGGIEGLNQDTWVVAYIAQIKASLHDIKYKFYMLCRGDDLRLIFCIPKREVELEPLLDVKNRILKVLSDNMLLLGQEVKIEDSYGSERFFTFCKQASVQNIELSQSYRKIQKCYGANNAFLETLDEYIAASFSNGHSAAKASTTPMPAYCVSLFWSIYDLKKSRQFRHLTEDQYIALMLVPSLAGGFPVIYLHNFFVRAESDLLTPFIDLYSYLKVCAPTVASLMKRFMFVGRKKPTTFEAIYNDPYTLPHERPVLPTGFLRAQMPESLERITNNEAIKELLEEVKSPKQQLTIKLLDTANILHAKPLSVIYQALPKAMLSSILKQFENSRSVLQLLCNTNKRRMVGIIRQAYFKEEQLQRWRYDVLMGSVSGRRYDHLIDPECPLKSSDDIREFCWGKKVVGVSMPALTHLISFYDKETAPISDHIDNNHFTYNIHKTVHTLESENSDHYSTGSQLPFVGYKTRPGTQMPQMHFVEHDPFLVHIKNMIELKSWFSEIHIDANGVETISNIGALVDKITQLYTTEKPNSFMPFAGLRRSGVVEHHLACQGFLASIVPNVLSNRYTLVSGKSDTHRRLVFESDKYKMNLLHIFCSSVGVITGELDVSKTLGYRNQEIYVVTNDCPHCNTPIEQHPLVFDTSLLERITFKPLKALRVSKDSMRIFQITSLALSQKKAHNLEVTKDLSVEVAATGIILEEFNTYRQSLRNITVDLQGHLPNAQGLDVLKNMHIQKVAKNTSITELKAIPPETLAKVLSQLVTDHVLGLSRKVFTIDQMTQLCTAPGHSYPWFKVLDSLSHTDLIHDMFHYLQKHTKSLSYHMATSVADQAVKLIPLALTYSLYYDHSPSRFVMISDLVPDVNMISFRNAVTRTVVHTIYNDCIKLLDPQLSMRRDLRANVMAVMYDPDHCTHDDKLRTRIFLRGVLMYLSGYLSRKIQFILPQESLNETKTLLEIKHTYMEYVDESDEEEADDDDSNDGYEDEALSIKKFDLPLICQALGDNLANLTDEEPNEIFQHLFDLMNDYSGNRLASFLTQTRVTIMTLMLILYYFYAVEPTKLQEEREKAQDLIDTSLMEIVCAPIVSCGQRLRQVVRGLKRKEQTERGLIALSLTKLSHVPVDKGFIYHRCQPIMVGAQVYTVGLFPARNTPHQYAQPKYVAPLRPFGVLTSSYMILAETSHVFRWTSRALKIFAAGVGFGGDLVFFQHMFPGSEVYVQTLLSGNYNASNIKLHYNPDLEPLLIHDEHLHAGYESLYESRTIKRAESEFGDDIMLYWIDVESVDDLSEAEYEAQCAIVVQYYLRTKSYEGTLVMKVRVNYTMTILKITAELTSKGLTVYPFRPNCMLPCNYIYLVTVGSCQASVSPYNLHVFDQLPLWQEHFHNINSVITRGHDVLNNMQDINNYELDGAMKSSIKPHLINTYAPALWRSVLCANTNLMITDAAIHKVTRHLNGYLKPNETKAERLAMAYSNFVFKYHELHAQALRQLNHEGGHDIVIDNQAARISVIQRCCYYTGFNLVLTFLQKHGSNCDFTTRDLHLQFIKYIKRFEYRDTAVADNNYQGLLRRDHNIHGVLTGYCTSYMSGVSTCLLFMGWVNFKYNCTATESRKRGG